MNASRIRSLAVAAGFLFAASAALADAPTLAPDRGDRIEHRLDRRGDRIDGRLDHRSERAEDLGFEHRANRLDRKGDRIDNRLDRRGNRIDRRFDRRHG